MNVFDFAIDLEKSGRRFYQKLADTAEAGGVKTIFTMMAEDERDLTEKLEAMKARAQTTTMEDSRALEYAKNIFEEHWEQGDAWNISDDLDAYNYAMKVEKDIHRLYVDAANKEQNPEVRNLLLKIAAEERRELEDIRKVYDFVNAPNEYLAWGEFSNLEEFHNFGREEG